MTSTKGRGFCLQIMTEDSATVLARVVVILGGRGARIRELCFRPEPEGGNRIECLVEAAPGRAVSLAAALARCVDVTSVRVDRQTSAMKGSAMRVVVDRVKCTGLGMCEAEAPDLFEVQQDGSLVLLCERPSPDRLAAARAAVEACPTEALSLAEG